MKDCEYCHSPAHIWFNCPKKPDGWKPERLIKNREPSPSSDCKSDALPKEGLAAASSNLGAPTKFDKKSWMREYMREYMRKRRAKNG